jgi:hypothetical protein
MINFVRRSVACAAIVAGSVLAPAAVASAAVTVPFQIDPYGPFDFPSVRCVAVVGEQPGTVTITGPEERKREGRSGCLPLSEVRWLNLSSGASGSTQMSVEYPEAVLPTGTGQVVVVVVHTGSSFVTPGVATVYVP